MIVMMMVALTVVVPSDNSGKCDNEAGQFISNMILLAWKYATV